MGKEKAQRHKGTKAQSNLIIFYIILVLLITHYSLNVTVVSASDAADKGTLVIPKHKDADANSSGKSAGVSAIVEDLQKKYAGIHDIKGAFVQKSYIKDLEETQEYSGAFFIKKPSHMMWTYAAPRDEKVIINNLDTWVYKKSQNQVIKTKFSKEAYSQVPIALLASLDNISNDFDITATGQNSLQLVPKRKIGFIKKLVMETMPGDMPVKMLTIFDTYGNIIMIELKDVKTNSGLNDSFFTFKIPPGTEVHDMSQ
ncbi:MAG: outer membrane lipoprotein carrier protein LolA [Nitrospirae bacterium]|nr:outer membrane lipoprotein carrier protein LolA [Nitrospirota bacterium]